MEGRTGSGMVVSKEQNRTGVNKPGIKILWIGVAMKAVAKRGRQTWDRVLGNEVLWKTPPLFPQPPTPPQRPEPPARHARPAQPSRPAPQNSKTSREERSKARNNREQLKNGKRHDLGRRWRAEKEHADVNIITFGAHCGGGKKGWADGDTGQWNYPICLLFATFSICRPLKQPANWGRS